MRQDDGADYAVLVIGGGLAACEAAHAAGRLGARTLLVAADPDRLADVAHNARVGGPARGTLVREVDALGGLTGRAADQALINIRRLHRGPTSWALRAAVDAQAFPAAVRALLAATPHVTIRRGVVVGLTPPAAPGGPWSVALAGAGVITARAVVLAVGKSLHGQGVRGRERWRWGPDDESLAADLAGLTRLARYHIAYPPILDRSGLDVAPLDRWAGSPSPLAFSHAPVPCAAPASWARAPIYAADVDRGWRDQAPSYRVPESRALAALLRTVESPALDAGLGAGPAGCDPLEVLARAGASRPLVLDPVSWHTATVYLRGADTALGADAQEQVLAAIPQLAGARLVRPGLTVTYAGLAAGALTESLSVRGWPGLYVAGAVAGCNGHEEAAAMGVIAGMNAARAARGLPEVTPGRAHGYIGAMVVEMAAGARLPYRVAHAAVDRRQVRSDNADLRLAAWGEALGLLDAAAARAARSKAAERAAAHAALARQVTPSAQVNARLCAAGLAPLRQVAAGAALLRRPGVRYEQLREALDLPPIAPATAEVVEIETRAAAMRAPARITGS